LLRSANCSEIVFFFCQKDLRKSRKSRLTSLNSDGDSGKRCLSHQMSYPLWSSALLIIGSIIQTCMLSDSFEESSTACRCLFGFWSLESALLERLTRFGSFWSCCADCVGSSSNPVVSSGPSKASSASRRGLELKPGIGIVGLSFREANGSTVLRMVVWVDGVVGGKGSVAQSWPRISLESKVGKSGARWLSFGAECGLLCEITAVVGTAAACEQRNAKIELTCCDCSLSEEADG